ncbi:MAG: sensor histidine kinase, partial [Roseburia sp.]
NLLSHMSWLIEAMLKMAKMDANTAYLKSEPVSIQELIRTTCEPFLIPMELHDQTLVRQLPDADVFFTGDMNWTAEALQNILKNCIEHISSGGEIRIQVSSNSLLTEIIIEDNGPGFSQEDLPHLFERFYKGSNSGSQSVGIGLALSRMIISAQNGTVKAENRPEGGARFIIHFYHNTTI